MRGLLRRSLEGRDGVTIMRESERHYRLDKELVFEFLFELGSSPIGHVALTMCPIAHS